jgi:LysE type translocator
MSIACLLTTHVVVATPGTGAVYSTAARLSRGSRAGIIAAFGCTLGVLPHIVAATTRLAAILHASAIAFQVIKWLGVAYFLHHLFEAVKRRLPIRRGRFHRRNQDAGFDQPVPHHLQRPRGRLERPRLSAPPTPWAGRAHAHRHRILADIQTGDPVEHDLHRSLPFLAREATIA